MHWILIAPPLTLTHLYTDDNGKEVFNADSLDKIIESLVNNEFSDTFIRSIQRTFAPLKEQFGKEDNLLVSPRLLHTELERLIYRACQIDRDSDTKKQLSKHYAKIFERLYKQDERIHNFFEILNICNFIVRQIKA